MMLKNAISILVICFLIFVTALPAGSKDVGKQDAGLQAARQLGKEGKYDEAIEKTKQFISQKQGAENTKAQLFLGLMYYKTKQYDNAIDSFARTIAIKINSPMAYYFLGLIYEAKALENKSGSGKSNDLKRKALEAWKNFLQYSDNKKVLSETHCNIGITPEESIKRAQSHVDTLEEDLGNE